MVTGDVTVEISKEFKKLKKRFDLPYLKLKFNKSLLQQYGCQSAFFWFRQEIVLLDHRITRQRMLSLLHEIAHAIQFKENHLVTDRRFKRKNYIKEFEAELFAIEQYEQYYKNIMGTCLDDNWALATYEDYSKITCNNNT
jgi:hypothetical protein